MHNQFTQEFHVTVRSIIERHNHQEKIRHFIARFHPPGISSGGESAIFFLKNIRISDCKKFFIEDVFRKPQYEKEFQVGIARKEIPAPNLRALTHEQSKEQLIKDYFLTDQPTHLFLKADYNK